MSSEDLYDEFHQSGRWTWWDYVAAAALLAVPVALLAAAVLWGYGR